MELIIMEFEILYTFMPPLVSHEGGRSSPYQGPASNRILGDFYTKGLLISLTLIYFWLVMWNVSTYSFTPYVKFRLLSYKSRVTCI